MAGFVAEVVCAEGEEEIGVLQECDYDSNSC